MSGSIGTASSAAHSSAAPAPPNALTSLSSNFNNFLNLLLTQLKNQDPSAPMDANAFTTELVQFSSVEQQITTNGSLTQLIQATQGSEVIQATGVVGKQVTLSNTQVPLQDGKASIGFDTAKAEPVAITLTNASGVKVRDESLTSTAGANEFAWDGTDNNGSKVPDGAYTATVTGTGAGGIAAAVPFTVKGTATGVVNTNGAVTLEVGGVAADFSKVQAVAGS